MSEAGGATHATAAVERYIRFWNAETPGDQRRLAAETYAEGVSYCTPVGVMHGSEELIGFRDQFAQHSPGYSFRARTAPEAHHDRARLQWELVVDGTTFATGTDVLELDDGGRIVSVTGFLDRPPAGFDPDATH